MCGGWRCGSIGCTRWCVPWLACGHRRSPVCLALGSRGAASNDSAWRRGTICGRCSLAAPSSGTRSRSSSFHGHRACTCCGSGRSAGTPGCARPAGPSGAWSPHSLSSCHSHDANGWPCSVPSRTWSWRRGPCHACCGCGGETHHRCCPRRRSGAWCRSSGRTGCGHSTWRCWEDCWCCKR